MDGASDVALEPGLAAFAPPAPSPATAARQPAGETSVTRAAAVLALALICAWSVAKGVIWGFHASENYFWVNTYAHGLVRRGLAGTLLSPVLGHADATLLKAVVLAINRASLGLIAMGLLLALARQACCWTAAAILLAVFAAAPFLGQTAFLVGFPDALIALCLAAILWTAWRGSLALLLPLIALGTLFHEFIPLAALPGVALAACLRPAMRLPSRVAMVAAILFGVVAMATAGRATEDAVQALARHLMALGDTPHDALYQARWRLTQSAGGDFAMVAAVWRAWWLNGLLGLAYATTPSLVLCVLGLPRLRQALDASPEPPAHAHQAASPPAPASTSRRVPAWRRAALGAWFGPSARHLPSWRMATWGITTWSVAMWRRLAGLHRPALVALYLAACFAPLVVLLIAIDLSRLAGFTAVTTLITILALPPAPLPRLGRTLAGATIALFLLLPVYSLHVPYAYAAHLRLLLPVCPACTRAYIGALAFYNRGQPQAMRDEALHNPAYRN